MSTLTKTLLATLAITLAGGAAFVMASPGDKSSSPAAPAAATVDVKGPCDEAEHANDPRCTGPQVPEDNANHVEHHHANRVDDNPGHDVNDDNGANDVNDDNPGEVEHHGNRGPGSQNSGPGNTEDRGDDNGVNDNSGPGSDDSGHSGSDESGSGHSGSDDSGSGGSGHD
jgi:hypothetical protein